VQRIEAAERSAKVGQEVAGEWLARTVVRGSYVPVLTDVFDRLALDMDPLEQVVYLHLYRLALGDERNFCRVSRRELQARANLSDRRLGKALSGLVGKDMVRLVQRDRAGTLYRVRLPHEVLGEAEPGDLYLARKPVAPARAPEPNPLPKPKAVKNVSHRADRVTVGSVAAAFLEKHAEGPGRSRAEVVEAILDRMEAGRSLTEIAEELQRFGQKAPKRTPVSELKRFA
jgi:hypothetical protein